MVKHTRMMALALVASLVTASGATLAQGMHQGTQGHGNSMSAQGGMGSGMMMQGMGGQGMGGQAMGGQGHGSMMNGQGGMGTGMMMGGMMTGMNPGMMMGGMGPMAGMTDGLNDQQISSLREMRQEHRATQLQRMGEMMNMRDDMMQIMQNERPDPEQVQALHDEMSSLRGEMIADNVRMRNQMLDVLTDEQRAQMRGNRSGQQ